MNSNAWNESLPMIGSVSLVRYCVHLSAYLYPRWLSVATRMRKVLDESSDIKQNDDLAGFFAQTKTKGTLLRLHLQQVIAHHEAQTRGFFNGLGNTLCSIQFRVSTMVQISGVTAPLCDT